VARRAQHDAATRQQGERPHVDHVRPQGFQPGADQLVQEPVRLLGGAVGGVDLDQGGGVRHRQVRVRHQIT
jgi:hypothetical protein